MKLLVLFTFTFYSVFARAESAVVLDFNNFKTQMSTIYYTKGSVDQIEVFDQKLGIGALKLERKSPNAYIASLVNSHGEIGSIELKTTKQGNLVKSGKTVNEQEVIQNEINLTEITKYEFMRGLIEHGSNLGAYVFSTASLSFTSALAFAYASTSVFFSGIVPSMFGLVIAFIALKFLIDSIIETKSTIDSSRLRSQAKRFLEPLIEEKEIFVEADTIYILCDDSSNLKNTRINCSTYKDFSKSLIEFSNNTK